MTRELIIECMVCNEECQEENSCFECADKQLTEYEKQIRAEAIDEYMNKLCDKCIQQPNECWNLECPFAADECQIIKIAEQLKEQNNTYTAKVDGVKREFM